MKKFIKTFCCAIFALASTCFLSACSESNNAIIIEKLHTSMVSLSYSETLYNGKQQTPTVTVTGENGVISADEYTVTYENNKNAGNAKVIISAKKDSKTLKGVVEKEFKINKTSIDVTTVNAFKLALDSNNYNEINVLCSVSTNNINGNNIVVDADETVKFGKANTLTNNHKLENNGNIYVYNYNGTGEIENNGNIYTEVANKAQLVNAFEFASNIKLTATIESPETTNEDADEINVVARNKNYRFLLDLNGNSIEVPLTFSNVYTVTGESYVLHCYDYGIDATITNSSNVLSTIGTNEYNYSYGVFLSGNHLMSLSLEGENKNIQLYGHTYALVTNGNHYNFNATLNATNCTFTSPDTNTPGMGAYLPASYNYNFKNCTFEGATGYYTKNGVHVIENCEIKGTGAQEPRNPQGEGGAPTGAAIDIDWGAWTTFPFDMSIYNSTLTSTNNVAIQEYPCWIYTENPDDDSLDKKNVTRHVEIKVYNSELNGTEDFFSANNFIKIFTTNN